MNFQGWTQYATRFLSLSRKCRGRVSVQLDKLEPESRAKTNIIAGRALLEHRWQLDGCPAPAGDGHATVTQGGQAVPHPSARGAGQQLLSWGKCGYCLPSARAAACRVRRAIIFKNVPRRDFSLLESMPESSKPKLLHLKKRDFSPCSSKEPEKVRLLWQCKIIAVSSTVPLWNL